MSLAVNTLYIFLIILIGAVIGATVLRNVLDDEQLKAYRTSTHSTGIEISNLAAITGTATGDASVDYATFNRIKFELRISGHTIQIAKVFPDKKLEVVFQLSTPFDLGNYQQSGDRFKISKVDDVIRIVAGR